jgi:L,D-peptidoglycan transpeptidase YkuD (ErfK/YbiS/YcfS/YnhG family)
MLRSAGKKGQNRIFPFIFIRFVRMTPLPATCRQLLLCLAADGEATAARLQRFERRPAGDWQAVGAAMPAMLGRSGLAWGRGLHAPGAGGLPAKREGDGRAPAGVFAISELFGAAAPDSALARAAKLPYRHATPELKAIDDPASAWYNRIVDQSAIARPDWASCEDMRRSDQRYAIGAVVDHNAEPPLPGAGSCIFLHVWQAPGVPTAGCTALALADMSEIAGWLDGACSPVLVQLPQAEYEVRREPWGLPPFAP